MQGVVFLGERKVALQEFPDPTPGSGEVVLEIKASGMCGSDLKLYRPPLGDGLRDLNLGSREPVIAGHEPCGVVAAVGPCVSEAEARVGMRVMVHHYLGCGVCNHCRAGWSQAHCKRRRCLLQRPGCCRANKTCRPGRREPRGRHSRPDRSTGAMD